MGRKKTCVHCGLISEYFANSAMAISTRNIPGNTQKLSSNCVQTALYTTVTGYLFPHLVSIRITAETENSTPSAQQTAAA